MLPAVCRRLAGKDWRLLEIGGCRPSTAAGAGKSCRDNCYHLGLLIPNPSPERAYRAAGAGAIRNSAVPYHLSPPQMTHPGPPMLVAGSGTFFYLKKS
jgi:hypothetical protein